MSRTPLSIRLIVVLGIAALLSACAARMAGVGDGAGASSSGAAYLAEIRSSAGLPPLAIDGRLERAALQQSGYMALAGKMSHTTGWRRDFAARMRKNGVEGAAAENIAAGRFDMAELFERWSNSAGHRRNMLDPRFSRFGLAYVSDAKGEVRYWTLVLGR